MGIRPETLTFTSHMVCVWILIYHSLCFMSMFTVNIFYVLKSIALMLAVLYYVYSFHSQYVDKAIGTCLKPKFSFKQTEKRPYLRDGSFFMLDSLQHTGCMLHSYGKKAKNIARRKDHYLPEGGADHHRSMQIKKKTILFGWSFYNSAPC